MWYGPWINKLSKGTVQWSSPWSWTHFWCTNQYLDVSMLVIFSDLTFSILQPLLGRFKIVDCSSRKRLKNNEIWGPYDLDDLGPSIGLREVRVVQLYGHFVTLGAVGHHDWKKVGEVRLQSNRNHLLQVAVWSVVNLGLVNYDFRVIITRKLLIFTTVQW